MKTKKEWICIEVACPVDLADHLAMEVAEAFGVGAEVTAGGIRFYLEGDSVGEERETTLKRIMMDVEDVFHPEPGLVVSHHTLEEQDWADRWKEFFKPLRVGRHFIICPTWETVEPREGDRIIRMDPGRAFGTGQHESTRLCLEWLEDCARGGRDRLKASRLLDVGTGSGVLSIAACLAGFGAVTAVDNDPEAIEVARENVDLNRMGATIRLMVGTAADLAERFDVVVANIQSGPLIEMAETLAGRLEDSGSLGLSGILVEQKEGVREAYEAKGLRLLETRIAGEWCLLAFDGPQVER